MWSSSKNSNRSNCFDDRCHVCLFDHLARDRYGNSKDSFSKDVDSQPRLCISVAKLPESFSPFVYRNGGEQDCVHFAPKCLADDEHFKALVAEVKRNRYGDGKRRKQRNRQSMIYVFVSSDLVTADGDLLLSVINPKRTHLCCQAIQAELAKQLKMQP